MVLTWHIPAGLHPDLPALSVLAQVLSEGITSRLHQKLVESGLCLSVNAFALELHDPGVLQVFALLAPAAEHVQVEKIIRAEVAALRRAAPSDEEVARAKIQVRTDLAFHRESPAAIAAGLTEAVAMGDWQSFAAEMERVSAVTTADLPRVAESYLHDRNLTVGWFVPENGSAAMGVPAAAAGPRPCYLEQPYDQRVSQHSVAGGARLAVLSNRHAPTVTMVGALRAGFAQAPEGRFTTAGLTAAMLDRGTANHNRLELARELENRGLQIAVETSSAAPSWVFFSAQGLAEQLPRLGSILFEVLRHPIFPGDELDKLKDKVTGALQRESQDSFSRAYAALTRRLYPYRHPCHRRAIEQRLAEVSEIEPQDLSAFHRATYHPGSMILVVVGDVEAPPVIETVGSLTEGWQGVAAAEPSWPETQPVRGGEERIELADRPNLDVFLGHAGSLRMTDDDYPAAVLANSCLGQSALTSRLGKEIRDRAGLTYGVVSRFFGTLQVPGPWATHLGVSVSNLEAAVELARTVIADYVREGPDEGELGDEREALAGAYRVRLATNSGIARELVTVLSAELPVSFLDSYPERLRQASHEQVLTALRRHIRPDELTMTAAGSFGSS
jgi:zinc protease